MYCAPSSYDRPLKFARGGTRGSQVTWLTFKSFLCQKPHFLKSFSSVWGRNSATPPKTCRTESSHELLHCLGRSHGGNPGRGWSMTQAESGLKKSVSFWDSPQLPSQTGPGGRHALTGKQPTPSGQRQCNLSWYSSARIPTHAAATC